MKYLKLCLALAGLPAFILVLQFSLIAVAESVPLHSVAALFGLISIASSAIYAWFVFDLFKNWR